MGFDVVEGRKTHGAQGGRVYGAPVILNTNSSSATRDDRFVYFVNQKGEIMPAPDSRVTAQQCGLDPAKWRRFEAQGAKEIEKISLMLSKQMFEKKKNMKVQQHLRERFTLEQLKFRCKLRAAQGFSLNDAELNKKILARAERAENALYDCIASEFDPNHRNTALAIEVKPQSTSKLAHINQKRMGIA